MKQFCVLDTAGYPIPGTVRDDSHSAVLAFFDVEGCKHFVGAGWTHCEKLGYRLGEVEVTVSGKKHLRPADYSKMSGREQWAIDKRLGILDAE